MEHTTAESAASLSSQNRVTAAQRHKFRLVPEDESSFRKRGEKKTWTCGIFSSRIISLVAARSTNAVLSGKAWSSKFN